MSRVNELIRELCPDGVIRRPLRSLGKRNKGTAITAAKMKTIGTGGPIRVFAGGKTVADVQEDAVPAKDVVHIPSIIVKSRGHIGFSYYERPFTHKAELWSYSIDDAEVDQKFVYYYLLTRVDMLQALARATSVKLPQLSVKDTDNLRIPVPPLGIQREIVRILDQFTQLEAELKTELEARNRQFDHYRRTQLSFDSSVRRVALSEVAIIRTGAPVSKRAIQENPGPYPVINSGREPLGYIGVSNTENDPIGVTSRGAGVGSITWCDEPYFRGNLNYGVTISDVDDVSPRFLFHLLQFLQPQIQSLCTFQGIPALNKANLEKLVVPLPSADDQERIAAQLDKFDALVNDLSVGLPAELAARRMQHEYYRDKLLTFPEASA